MAGNFFIDWASLAISLFNTILLVWLGLTVLFNAERRVWGVILAVGGLLAGAGFFASHSIVLSQGATSLIQGFSFWWHVGWAPLIAAPYAWYLLMLWYCGHWDDQQTALHRRRQSWLWFSVAYTLLLGGLLLLANPLPSIAHESYVDVARLPALGAVPLITLAYPPYILMCIGLSLEALLRPAPSSRVMGDLARRRARPWLTGASLVLLLVSLLVGGIILWLVQEARLRPAIEDLIYSLATPLSVLDLILAALLMTSVLLLGQAVVSYEIFTGKTLPRRGFLIQWRNTVLLAAALSLVSAWGVTVQVSQVYTILALLVLVAFSYAWFGWQSYADREGSIRQLRPFVTSQRLFESILTPSPAEEPDLDLSEPFSALCRDVLGASQATLVPLGPLAALGGTPLRYPSGSQLSNPPPLAELKARFTSPQTNGCPLDPGEYGGITWAAPLWNERGLIGLLLLGEKSDGGFYSLEEIEIARASGERLADIQASAELSRRLVILQRQRLAEGQVLDRQARRVLHDDVLPRLHAILLDISADGAQTKAENGAVKALGELHRMVSNLLRELPAATAPEVASLGLVGALRQVVEGELKGAFDQVEWLIPQDVERRAQGLPALKAEVLFYAAREALRNTALHARKQQSDEPLHLCVNAAWMNGLEVSIEDNGIGLGGTPVTTARGSGQGLTLHSTLMAVMGGSLAVESAPGVSTRVVLRIPEG